MLERVGSATDVLVIGGGPAGSTAASLLARQGFDVTLLERDHFPRYHIGESLLPSLLPLLDLLGARQEVERQGFVRKSGAYYDWGGQEWEIRFGGRGKLPEYSFQVVRSAFDHLLLNHARRQGVKVHEGVTVRRITLQDGRAVAAAWSSNADDGVISFRHVIDASGRYGVLAARQLRTRRFHDVFRNIATWGYWRDATPVPHAPPGAICLFSLPDHGWFWAIPLHDDTLSVGLVTDKYSFANARREANGSIKAVYDDQRRNSPGLSRILTGAKLTSPLRLESDYSYVADQFCGPGYYLAGDAACFLDPLLSTGVHLAMHSALLAAAAIASVQRGQVTEDAARAFYQTAYRHAYERLLILVGAFYHIHQGRDAYFRRAQTLSHRDRSDLHLNEAFVDIVTGIEDLHDAQLDDVSALFDRLRAPLPGHRAVGLGGHGASLMTPWPTSETHAAAGLCLTLSPQLGLKTTGPTALR